MIFWLALAAAVTGLLWYMVAAPGRSHSGLLLPLTAHYDSVAGSPGANDTAFYRYPHYHTAQDTPDKLDYDRLARVVTGLHGMLRELARAE